MRRTLTVAGLLLVGLASATTSASAQPDSGQTYLKTINKKTYIKKTGTNLRAKQLILDGPTKPSMCQNCIGQHWDLGQPLSGLDGFHTNIGIDTITHKKYLENTQINLGLYLSSAFIVNHTHKDGLPGFITAYKKTEKWQTEDGQNYAGTTIYYIDPLTYKTALSTECSLQETKNITKTLHKTEKCATKTAKYVIKTYNKQKHPNTKISFTKPT